MANYRAHCRNVTGTSCRFLGSVALLCMATQVEALDKSWDGGAAPAGLDGTFNVGANWHTNTSPGAADVAHFGTSAVTVHNSYTVSFTTNPTNQALVVEDDSVTFDLDGHLYTMTATNPITLGVTSGFGLLSSRLTIREGFVIVPSESLIKIGASLRGFLTITTGGLLGGLPQIQLGDFGNGTLTVDSGGDISASDVSVGSNTGINGTATITGNGSSLLTRVLNVGDGGVGTLDIAGGGDVDSDSSIIGRFTSSRGTASVRDSGSTWNVSGLLIVGDEAPGTPGVVAGGTLNIMGGGRVENANATIGNMSDSTGKAIVDGTLGNSLWFNSGSLIVGKAGTGTLEIKAGGRVDSTGGSVGGREGFSGPRGTGYVNVAGTNSKWINSGDLSVGSSGDGTLEVGPGGRVQSVHGTLGDNFEGNGIVSIANDSQWINSGDLTVGRIGQGTLSVAAGGRVESFNGFVGSSFGGSGEFEVNGGTARWINTGELSVGKNGSGTLLILAGGRVDNTNGFIGRDQDGDGQVTVDGKDDQNVASQWVNSGHLSVAGGLGDGGTLSITNGGQVHSASGLVGNNFSAANAVVFVDGMNSQWIMTGDLQLDFQAAELTIRNGGRVENRNGTIGKDVTISGDSRWINSGNLVGHLNLGTLNIIDGGTVESADGAVGVAATISDDGSQWLNSGKLQTSDIAPSTLNILDGGRVQNTDGFVGSNMPGNPQPTNVTVDAAQWFNSGELTIGHKSSANLQITNGGRVQNTNGFVGISSFAGGVGFVRVAGLNSLWTTTGRLTFGAGTLEIQPGGTVNVTQDTVFGFEGKLELEGGTFSTTAISFNPGGIFEWTSGTLHVGVFNGSITVPNNGVDTS